MFRPEPPPDEVCGDRAESFESTKLFVDNETSVVGDAVTFTDSSFLTLLLPLAVGMSFSLRFCVQLLTIIIKM